MRIDELTARIERTAPRAGDTRVVAIDGPAGSGKTTLAGRLADGFRAPVVHMDDLYPGWDGLADAPARLLEWERDGETFRPHWDCWAAQEEAHFAADGTADRADVRLDGAPTIAHDPELEVVPLR